MSAPAQTLSASGAILKGPDGVETVVTGHSETPSDGIPPAVFVEDKQHQLFMVDRELKLLLDRSYLICSCGPPVSGAGLCRRPRVR